MKPPPPAPTVPAAATTTAAQFNALRGTTVQRYSFTPKQSKRAR